MAKQRPNSSQIRSNRPIMVSISVFAICFSILFFIQWRCLYNNIELVKESNKKNFESFLQTKKSKPFNLDLKKINGKQLLIDSKEIDKINTHIDLLTDQVYKESNRAESIMDKDFDRLNLYMALGIGFMTLFGIFIPLIVNVLIVNDLRDKIKEMPSASVIDLLTLNTNKALESSEKVEKLSEDIDELVKKTADVYPKISTLSFQIAINRLFNVSPTAITKILRKRDFTLFKNLFQNVKNELEKCQNDVDHKIHDNESLKQTISDFAVMLKDEKYKFSSVLNSRNLVIKLDSLSTILVKLSLSNESNEIGNCLDTIEILDKVILEIQLMSVPLVTS
ncbi:hypothetical protein [Pedobacter mucosus]|uniref:hypothetical protein n=1 Tax=Pedobacter mucosus TaxID=2895286 RepID=UPI001EE4B897|nr:hypothetical protein [Pedobacter mucosus]UKT65459.1 hypothetical protein LOK61_06645 [Pedobacter mucosus]